VKILYLAHRLPFPPSKGEKIRTFHQIQQLTKKHTIHLCTFLDDPDDLPHVTELRKYCSSVEAVYRDRSAGVYRRAAIGILRGLPLSVSLFYRAALARKVFQVMAAERFDCIIVSCSSMAQYVACSSGTPRIIDFIDVDSEKWRLYAQYRSFPLSLIYSCEAARLASYEENITELFDHSILCSKQETEIFCKQAKEAPVSVISNGVDLEYFLPSPISGTPNQQAVVFIGAMDYFPNIDAVQFFCREIFPRVRSELPSTQFYIVGRNPSPQVRQLGKQPNVIVTGTVPDVRPYLVQASVAVAPFRLARGVQNKILESMAMGVPVVGTREAFKGLAATEQDGIRVVDDPRSFGQHVIAFLQGDATSRCQAARQARAYVERHHRWEDRGAELERLIEEVVRKHRQKENVVHRRGAEYAEARV
jgi:sugar transferase (PEP-CTERM/EpsH1 system associated)